MGGQGGDSPPSWGGGGGGGASPPTLPTVYIIIYSIAVLDSVPHLGQLTGE